jgi:GNAT superfamily N-acetyltransferase
MQPLSVCPQVPGRQLAVRPIGPADTGFLSRLYASTRAEELALTHWDDDHKQAFLAMQFTAQHAYYQEHYRGAAFDLILLAGMPIGRIYLARWEDQVRIVDIALLPEHRGQGIGTAFLRAVLAEGARLGLAVTIHVERFNPALRLYERLGFRTAADKGVYLLLRWASEEMHHAG